MAEFVSPEGLRLDGRRCGESRKTQLRLGLFVHADGSCYLEQGYTKVIATVHGPREATRALAQSGSMSDASTVSGASVSTLQASAERIARSSVLDSAITTGVAPQSQSQSSSSSGQSQAQSSLDASLLAGAVLSCTVSLATFSSGERRVRSRMDRALSHLSSCITETLQSVVLTHLYPEGTQIALFVQVLQADGGVLAAAINAAVAALMDAGVAMVDTLVANSCSTITASHASITPAIAQYTILNTNTDSSSADSMAKGGGLSSILVLDPNHREEGHATATFVVAYLAKSGRVASTWLEGRCALHVAPVLMAHAIDGAKQIHSIVDYMVRCQISNRYT
jgi:ribonuclease PH